MLSRRVPVDTTKFIIIFQKMKLPENGEVKGQRHSLRKRLWNSKFSILVI